MAITYTAQRKGIASTAQTSTTAFSPGTTLAAGSLGVIAIVSTSGKVATGVTDSVGNTWTVDYTNVGDGTRAVSFASCQVGTQVTTGGTITVTWSSSTSANVIGWLFEVANAATSSAFDQAVTGTGSGTAPLSPSSGASGTLANADSIVFGLGAVDSSSAIWAKGASYTDPTSPSTVAGSAKASAEYKVVAATTAVTADGTWSTAGTNWVEAAAVYKGVSAGSPPANTVAPAVTGTGNVGSVLTTTNGTWTGTATITFTYQWQRDVAGNGVFSNISSATSSTYTLVEADDGNKVRCQVTGTNGSGNATASSNAVGLITEAAAPTNSVAPVVSGTTTVGQSLSTTNGTWTAMGGSVATFAYQWQRDNTGGGVYSNIASATASSYTLVDADDACHIRCNVTATNDVGASSPASSNAVGTIVEPVPTNSVAPVASGTARVNVTVSSTTGTWTHQGGTVATYAYQWQDSADGSTGWANVTGATSSSYTIASGELNKFLRCNVTATNTGGTSSATSSNVLGPVAAAAASTSNLGLFSSAGRFLRMKGLR